MQRRRTNVREERLNRSYRQHRQCAGGGKSCRDGGGGGGMRVVTGKKGLEAVE